MYFYPYGIFKILASSGNIMEYVSIHCWMEYTDIVSCLQIINIRSSLKETSRFLPNNAVGINTLHNNLKGSIYSKIRTLILILVV